MIAPSAGPVIILVGKMWPYGEYRLHEQPRVFICKFAN